MNLRIYVVLALATILFLSANTFAQKSVGVAIESDSIAPAPASIGADVPVTYFGLLPQQFSVNSWAPINC